MLRSEWQFEYSAETLLEAAEKEFDKRVERIEYWKGKREEVLEKLKAEGLEITNWGSGETKAEVGTRIDVQFDQKLMARLRECEQYLSKARNEKKEFAMWIQAFSDRQPGEGFKLHAQDISFFGLGKSAEPDFVAPEDAEAQQESTAPSGIRTPPVTA